MKPRSYLPQGSGPKQTGSKWAISVGIHTGHSRGAASDTLQTHSAWIQLAPLLTPGTLLHPTTGRQQASDQIQDTHAGRNIVPCPCLAETPHGHVSVRKEGATAQLNPQCFLTNANEAAVPRAAACC
jgi:hypothetical protein